MGIKRPYRLPFAGLPAVRLTLLLAAGITCDYLFNRTSWEWVVLFGLLALLYLTGEQIHRRFFRTQIYSLTILAYLAMVVVFGGAWHAFWDYRDPPPVADVLNSYTWEELIFKGQIRQINETASAKRQVDVAVDTTVFPGGLRWRKTYNIRAILKPETPPHPRRLQPGQYLTFTGTVYPLEEKRNPHQFNYKRHLATMGIHARAGIDRITAVRTTGSSWRGWPQIRQYALEAIDNNFEAGAAPLAKALLIGYKNELNRPNKRLFSRAGLSHIMAVSGLHVAFILMPFWGIIPFLWNFRFGKQIGLSLVIGTLFFYAGLTGFTASVSRASLAGGLLIYAHLFHKIRNAKNLMAVAGFVILTLHPGELIAIGFQLSFAAVYIILLTVPVVRQYLPGWISYRWYGKPAMAFIISLLVQAGLYPLLAYYFGEISIAGPLVNALIVPVLGVAVPYALLMVTLAAVFPKLAALLNMPVNYLFDRIIRLVDFIGNEGWSWIQVRVESPYLFLLWATFIFFIASVNVPRMRWKILCLSLLFLCLHQGQELWQKVGVTELTVTFFDVGQGDAALIETPGGRHFLIDTGQWSPTYNSARYVILPHLRAEGITRLDAVFLSHPHADHIGGITELIENIPVDTIYNSGSSHDSQLYRTYLKKAAGAKIPVRALSAGDRVTLDPAIRILVYGPEGKASGSANNRSLVLEVIYGSTQFLFAGDAEKEQEQRLVDHFPKLLNTDLLKVAHHGSNTSSHATFLHHTTPAWSAVSLGKSNRFQHPDPAAVRRIQRTGTRLLFTGLSGALIFKSDGHTIKRVRWK